ncbi:hypothetical protein THASP1DRAFT_24865 [Thamnocephalis sphaerospora]|uniref:Uncharacterized protein n=1 Tax=Thamnocephalis sphaerospora TaxID=78915 RepID=A0A4P9XLX9_9FUNG|nr:hypothetical protein THASP1DRAFT_24865 [Thamnocephalis sphaerospora]|eukprot:RKP06893.1 hypothetical protein THASP1DRAFT_24865 [Thamnocephalis sphaerospora]
MLALRHSLWLVAILAFTVTPSIAHPTSTISVESSQPQPHPLSTPTPVPEPTRVRRWLPDMSLPPAPRVTGVAADRGRIARDAAATNCLLSLDARNFVANFADRTFETSVRVLEANSAALKELLPFLRQGCQRTAQHLAHYMSDAMARNAGQATYKTLAGNSAADDLDPDWPGTDPMRPAVNKGVTNTSPDMTPASAPTSIVQQFTRSLSDRATAFTIKARLYTAASGLTRTVAMTWHLDHFTDAFQPSTNCQSDACNTLRQRLRERRQALQNALEKTIAPLTYAETGTLREATNRAVDYAVITA